MKEIHNPWYYSNHNYITPENIQAAIDAGGAKLEVWEVTLQALADGACEDSGCCAFVALKFNRKGETTND